MSMIDPQTGIGDRETCPEPMELAAFADGRIGADARVPLARHIAQCDRCSDAVSGVRSADDDALTFVPAHVLHRAKSLVTLPAEITVVRRQKWLTRGLQGLVAAAAALAICVVGYQVGASLNGADREPADQLAIELSFELFDESSVNEDELQLFALNAQGAVQ
jgi:anti-sigma factor RsiW